MKNVLLCAALLLPLIGLSPEIQAQITNVGSGSYTTTFPGVDAAGRNSFPSGTPYITGNAANKPIPTNDWWSAQVKNPHADNLFSYPFTMKSINQGLIVTYIPWGVIDAFSPITVGVTGLNASSANISDFSDWTVSMDWDNGAHHFQATSGIGMPFLYFEKGATDVAEVTITQGSTVIDNEMLVITGAHNGADFAIYAPTGSVWTQNGNTYTSTLNGQNYWSMAFLPFAGASANAVAQSYKKYAYVFPTDTRADWQFDPQTSVMTTDFVVEVGVKEGTDSTILQGLLPHQWANLAATSPVPAGYSYPNVRGEIKTLEGNSFSVANTFHGILPTLPYLDYYSQGFSPQTLNQKISLLKNDGLATWTDSYNEGQMMNRLIQSARIAELMGDSAALGTMLATVKARLEDWLKINGGEVAFLFYYNTTWTAMIGYPAGHGQDGNINDHHFHWGYFIHAAAFLEQYEPGWAAQWGDMINLLVRDAASPDRNDSMFPFLRNFSPYAGHSWANGFASFPQGNDQESTSESMQFASSLIHWGSVIGNDSIRDLGIYLYTTEQTAIEEYWFDMYERNFQSNQPYSLVSRVWGNSYDNGTFWTSDIAASYGIELYPIHGGSLYLGHDTTYAKKLWAEIEANTGILANEVNPNLWHDVMWQYLAFTDPDKALNLYNAYPERDLKFGVSDAQTYHWLHAMRVLGNVDVSVTADHPLAVVFDKSGDRTYVAQNYGSDSLTVSFSDGFVLEVPPFRLTTSKDVSLDGTLTASFSEAYPGGSVDLELVINSGNPTQVEFVDGETLLGQLTQAPYVFKATNLAVGRRSFYARIYEGTNFTVSNLVPVIVGEQLPFLGNPSAIPGVIEAGYFDIFEGGSGQEIAYNDVSVGNNGDFRPNENVDVALIPNEGATVGWIAAGEWLEYTVDVQQAGNYTLSFRYACGNNSGGGPFRLEADGAVVRSGITAPYTGDWNSWSTRSVSNIPLKSGKQVLRVFFENGELNMGKMTFSYDSPLAYSQPVADAGDNILVLLPMNNTILDASQSSDPANGTLTYSWTQVYGPSRLTFSNAQAAQPSISTLEEGVYLLKLTVDNGSYQDEDELYVISSSTGIVPPKVSIYAPFDQSSFIEGDMVTVAAAASDLIGQVSKVDFFADGTLIGTATQAPYEITWSANTAGTYDLTAVAEDDDNSSTTSSPVQVEITEAPACRATSSNGEFEFEFSPDDDNPTLTFIPSVNGQGSPTCILYYGTNPSSLPGYPVTPNVPYQLNASEGTQIYFYYTYSYPGQGERNNAGDKDSYVIGSCRNATSLEDQVELEVAYYPNPVSDVLTLELPFGDNQVQVYDLQGKILDSFSTRSQQMEYDMSPYASGAYLFRVWNGGKMKMFKVMR
ncbi:MAG: glycosyl hydrolase [Bacteroidota bacterium]